LAKMPSEDKLIRLGFVVLLGCLVMFPKPAFCEERTTPSLQNQETVMAVTVPDENEKLAEELENDLIKPKQTLEIEVYGEPDLTRTVVIDSKGFITFPLIGRVEVAGLTEEEATNKIYTLLERDYLVNPEVSLSRSTTLLEELERLEEKEEANVVLHSYVILGEVGKPGTYEFDSAKGEMTLLKAISIAGGFSPIANEKKIKLLKRDGVKTRALVINAVSILAGKQEDEVITDNDLILVPESMF